MERFDFGMTVSSYPEIFLFCPILTESRPNDHSPYGVAITDAIASGERQTMKEAARATEEHLAKHGDVATLLQHLKIGIARAER